MAWWLTALGLVVGSALADEPTSDTAPEVEASADATEAPARPVLEAMGGDMQDNDYGNVAPQLAQPALGEEEVPAEGEPEPAPEGEPEPAPAPAPEPEPGAPPEPEPAPAKRERARPFGTQDLQESLDLYGSFRSHLAITQDDVEIQNNSSRFGIRAGAAIPGVMTLYARAEWGVNFGASAGFNVDGNTGAVQASDEDSPFFTRLGLVGIDFGKYGVLSFGKQWGVYYDVAKLTDRMMVFTSTASSVYNAGTDGGVTGTGRASNALAYRFRLFGVTLGAQVQLFADRPWIVDTYGFAARYDAPFGLSVGAAFNDARVGGAFEGTDAVGIRSGDQAWAFTTAAAIDLGTFYAAALYARTHEHEAEEAGTGADEGLYFYNTDGIEVVVQYKWAQILGPYVAYNGVLPRDPPSEFDDKFASHKLVYGFSAQFYRYALLYVEGKTDFGRTVTGDARPSVLTIGVRVDFSSERVVQQAIDKAQATAAATPAP